MSDPRQIEQRDPLMISNIKLGFEIDMYDLDVRPAISERLTEKNKQDDDCESLHNIPVEEDSVDVNDFMNHEQQQMEAAAQQVKETHSMCSIHQIHHNRLRQTSQLSKFRLSFGEIDEFYQDQHANQASHQPNNHLHSNFHNDYNVHKKGSIDGALETNKDGTNGTIAANTTCIFDKTSHMLFNPNLRSFEEQSDQTDAQLSILSRRRISTRCNVATGAITSIPLTLPALATCNNNNTLHPPQTFMRQVNVTGNTKHIFLTVPDYIPPLLVAASISISSSKLLTDGIPSSQSKADHVIQLVPDTSDHLLSRQRLVSESSATAATAAVAGEKKNAIIGVTCQPNNTENKGQEQKQQIINTLVSEINIKSTISYINHDEQPQMQPQQSINYQYKQQECQLQQQQNISILPEISSTDRLGGLNTSVRYQHQLIAPTSLVCEHDMFILLKKTLDCIIEQNKNDKQVRKIMKEYMVSYKKQLDFTPISVTTTMTMTTPRNGKVYNSQAVIGKNTLSIDEQAMAALIYNAQLKVNYKDEINIKAKLVFDAERFLKDKIVSQISLLPENEMTAFAGARIKQSALLTIARTEYLHFRRLVVFTSICSILAWMMIVLQCYFDHSSQSTLFLLAYCLCQLVEFIMLATFMHFQSESTFSRKFLYTAISLSVIQLAFVSGNEILDASLSDGYQIANITFAIVVSVQVIFITESRKAAKRFLSCFRIRKLM